MIIKLKCIKNVTLSSGLYCDKRKHEFRIGDIVDFCIENNGIRVKIDDCYSFPYDVDVIKEYFEQE